MKIKLHLHMKVKLHLHMKIKLHLHVKMKLCLCEESTKELPMLTKTCELCLKCLECKETKFFAEIDTFVYLFLLFLQNLNCISQFLHHRSYLQQNKRLCRVITTSNTLDSSHFNSSCCSCKNTVNIKRFQQVL